MDVNVLLELVEDQAVCFDVTVRGNKLYGNPKVKTIEKIYLNYGNVGKKRGLRLMALVLATKNQIILLHLYSKSQKKKQLKKKMKI